MNKLFTRIMATVAGFAMAIGVGVGIGTNTAKAVYAEDELAYTINLTGEQTESTSLSTSNLSNITGDGVSTYINSLTTCTKTYGPTSNGVKLGASSNAGTLTFSLKAAGQVTATKYVVNAKLYNSSKTATLNVNSIGAQSVTADFSDLTFTPNPASSITSITLASSKYIWVKSVSVYVDGSGSQQQKTATTTTVSAAEDKDQLDLTLSPADTVQLSASVTYEDNGTQTISDPGITWSGNNNSVATISETGLVTAVGRGVARFTASYAGDETYASSSGYIDISVSNPNEVVFTAGTDIGGSSGQNEDTITKGAVSMYCSSMHDTGDAYRYYKDSTVRFTAENRYITSIEFTGNDGSNKISNIGSASVGSLSTNSNNNTASWTGYASQVEFTMSAQGRASAVIVTLAPTNPALVLSTSSVSLKTNESDGKQVTATVYNVDNPQFVWTRLNENIIVEVSNNDNVSTATIKPNSLVAVDTSVTLTITGTDLSETISVSISVPGPGETAETAYSVSDAKTAINNSVADLENVYISGKISQIDQYFSNTHSINYWISDDGATTNQFKIYGGKGLNGADFESIDDLCLGDQVVLFGTISKQYSNLNAGSSIISLIPAPRVNSITLTPAAITVEPEATGDVVDLFTNIVINQDDGSNKSLNDISWSSDNNDVFYIADGEYLACDQHRSSTTIRASIGGREYGRATVTIIDSSIYSISYDVAEEWVLVSDPSTLVAGDRVILTGVKNEVTYAAGTYSSGNNVPADTTNPLTVNGNKVTGVVSTMIYTLEEGSVDGSLAFKDSANKYLYAAGASSSNYMKTQDSINNNASFILGADGEVVAQGTGSRSHMRYNNYGASNLFSCYEVDASTDTNVTFYKRIGGAGVIDLPSLSMVATISARESTSNDVTTVTSPSLRFGASISVENWNAINSNCQITDYGVMCLKRTTLDSYQGINSVKEAYEGGRKVTNLHKCSNDREFAVPYENNGNYVFTVRIDVNDPAYYTTSIVAAPYILAGGQYYFLGEMEYSIRTLAQHYLDDNTLQIALSNSALRVLAGN